MKKVLEPKFYNRLKVDSMLADTNERPCVEETYSIAQNTSDLTLEVDHTRPMRAADVLIANAWNPTRLGGALLRLHSEWDRAEKPPKMSQEQIKGLVGTQQREILPKNKDEQPAWRIGEGGLTTGQAKLYAAAWHRQEMDMLCGRLGVLTIVREQIAMQCLKWGMGQPDDIDARHALADIEKAEVQSLKELAMAVEASEGDDKKAAQSVLERANLTAMARQRREREAAQARATEKAASIIRFWLDQTCQSCHGLRWKVFAGTPSLSNRACGHCAGTGRGGIPHGQMGRKMLNYMDDAVQMARRAIQKRLRSPKA